MDFKDYAARFNLVPHNFTYFEKVVLVPGANGAHTVILKIRPQFVGGSFDLVYCLLNEPGLGFVMSHEDDEEASLRHVPTGVIFQTDVENEWTPFIAGDEIEMGTI